MNPNQVKKFILSWAKKGRKEYLKDSSECEIYLKRLQYFLDLIGNPEKQIPHYIHVTGTSGKGSVCLMLDSILRTDKRKIGTMISPEIGATQARWQINGKTMSDTEFTKILTELKPKLVEYLKTSPYDPISHFELMTAIGLYYFAKHKVKWCILEVGMGGRYDSTNIIPYKDIAVITNIGLDHTEILGKTKEKIAYEKAGIIKPGCKVFTGERDKKILNIIKAECKKNLISYVLNSKSRDIKRKTYDIRGEKFEYQNKTYNLPCLGEHQINNSILAIEISKSLKIPYASIKLGLAKVRLPLRLEIISKKPLIILDGAHNPDKMATTVATIKNLKLKIKNYHLVVGFSEDKDIKTMCQQLLTLKPSSIAITKFHSHFKKSTEPKNIIKYFSKLVLVPLSHHEVSDSQRKAKIFSDPVKAYFWSKNKLKNDDLLLVTGSLYLSGEIRGKIDKMI